MLSTPSALQDVAAVACRTCKTVTDGDMTMMQLVANLLCNMPIAMPPTLQHSDGGSSARLVMSTHAGMQAHPDARAHLRLQSGLAPASDPMRRSRCTTIGLIVAQLHRESLECMFFRESNERVTASVCHSWRRGATEIASCPRSRLQRSQPSCLTILIIRTDQIVGRIPLTPGASFPGVRGDC